MSTIRERITMVREEKEMSATAFAKVVGVTQSYISQFTKYPDKPVSEQLITNVCREFRVNEQWLREGVGQMFEELSIEDEIDAFCGDVKRMPEDDPRRTIMRLLARLDESEWESIASMIEKLKEEQ